MRGRWTLTATGSPLRSVARWTWPIDADGERGGLEGREHDLGLGAELLADDRPDLVVAERRDLVEQAEQLVAVRGRQEVVAEREHLPELHPRAAELLERDPQAHGAGSLVGAGQPDRGPDEQAQEHAPATWPSRRGCLNSVLMRGRGRSPARCAAAASRRVGQSASSSSGTRRRRLGIAVSSSHSRPALISSAYVRRENR